MQGCTPAWNASQHSEPHHYRTQGGRQSTSYRLAPHAAAHGAPRAPRNGEEGRALAVPALIKTKGSQKAALPYCCHALMLREAKHPLHQKNGGPEGPPL